MSRKFIGLITLLSFIFCSFQKADTVEAGLKGKVSKVITYHYFFETDSSGNIKKKGIDTIEETYNRFGYLLTHVEKMAPRRHGFTYEYFYQNDSILLCSTRSCEGRFLDSLVVHYENGKEVEEDCYGDSGLIYKEVYSYKFRKVLSTLYRVGEDTFRTCKVYDGKKRLLKSESINCSDKFDTRTLAKFWYSHNGNVIKEYHKVDRIEYTSRTKYDKGGNALVYDSDGPDDYKVHTESKYEFDEKGNWIECIDTITENQNGKTTVSSFHIERIISYW